MFAIIFTAKNYIAYACVFSIYWIKFTGWNEATEAFLEEAVTADEKLSTVISEASNFTLEVPFCQIRFILYSSFKG